MSQPNARPSSALPFEVVVENHRAYIYPRRSLDPSRRTGLPLRSVCLTERRSSAQRGESRPWVGFDPGDLQDLHYLAHAAIAYPKLVALIKAHAKNREMPDAEALLRELGEAP